MSYQEAFAFMDNPKDITEKKIATPAGYSGIYGFHKYWGKKPHEPIAFIIEALTKAGQVVVDPFVGYGTTGREAVIRSRRFIGFDINPTAVELTRLLLSPPDFTETKKAVERIEAETKEKINESYLLQDKETTATHFLWEKELMSKVWIAGKGKSRKRQEIEPTKHDIELFNSFNKYKCKHIRPPKFFDNGRIA